MELPASNKQFYYRLIALWAVCEGTLGGIIHGFQLPITGLIVGSSAVIIICLIGYYVPEKGAILKATVLVAIFKLMLSPHSPIGAYYAVFFQGILGELFFMNKKYYKTSCIVFATLALAESGAQGILVATIIYGTDFWSAVNKFISGLTHQDTVTNYSLYIGSVYLLLHIVVGFFVGILASKIPALLPGWKTDLQLKDDLVINTHAVKNNEILQSKKRGKIRLGLFVIWIILCVVWMLSAIDIEIPFIEQQEVIHIILRSFFILLTWYFLVVPLMLFFMKKWLMKQQSKMQSTIQEIVLLIPSTTAVVEKSWSLTDAQKGIKRLHIFLKTVLVNTLFPQ